MIHLHRSGEEQLNIENESFLMPPHKGLSTFFGHATQERSQFYHELNAFVSYKAASGFASKKYDSPMKIS